MARLALLNARMLSEAGWSAGGLAICDGRITDILPPEANPLEFDEVLDLEGARLAPGFCDVQVNGGGGVLFNDDPTAASACTIAAAHRAFGTTSLTPTLISDDLDKVTQAITAIDEAVAAGAPGIVGVHIEGPFLNVEKKGVHDGAKLRRLSEAMLAPLTAARHARVVLTLAPELADSAHIRALTHAGVRVCAGHTNATYEEALRALQAGVSGFTHLFNAMSPLQSRAPGVIAAALESSAWCGLIVDGRHVHPAMLRLALRAKADARFLLVTDAMPGVGAQLDHFYLGGRRIDITEGRCLAEDGTLAGSTLSMIEAVRNAAAWLELDAATALRMASSNPAEFLGLGGSIGALKPGRRADLVALGPDLRLLGVWLGGTRVAQGEGPG